MMGTVGQALVHGLAARGVEVVFGIPGVHTVELYRGLAGGRVRHVTARHEQAAGFMADGYARVSGKPGVAFVITGPGVTNALTAMAQARADSVPVLVISGVNRDGRELGRLHELPDQAAMVRALCPTERITDPARVGPALDRAFAAMLSGRPGPAHIEVPVDVMGRAAPDPANPVPPARPGLPDEAALRDAVARLDRAARVVILAGGGARRADLAPLAGALDAPVVMTANARGALHGHPLAVPASPSLAPVRDLIRGADVVLALGTEIGPTDYDLYVDGGTPDLSGMIRVDAGRAMLDRDPCALALHGDAVATAAWLAAHAAPRSGDGAARAAHARQAARDALGGLHRDYPHQLAMLEAIRDARPGTILVGDSTQPVYAGNLWFDADRPGGWFNAATGYGALGYGVGAALGAAIAASGAPVVCLVGDGGLQFTAAELRTAVDERLRVDFVVWNNAAYREIAEWMAAAGTEVIGCHPSPLRLEPFAAACDLPFTSVADDPAALRSALAAPADGPRLIEVRVRT